MDVDRGSESEALTSLGKLTAIILRSSKGQGKLVSSAGLYALKQEGEWRRKRSFVGWEENAMSMFLLFFPGALQIAVAKIRA